MTNPETRKQMLAEIPTGLLIDGKNSSADSDRKFSVVDPADGSIITHVSDGSVDDGLRAVEAASAASLAWAATSPRHRSDILMRCYRDMMERKEWFAELISYENGKAMRDARAEVVYAAEFFRWYAEEAVRVLGEVSISPSGNNRILVHHQPIGVAVLVTPWNFPAAMATRKIGPALASGCTCVLKPAAETPLTALAIGALMTNAGIPAGVVNIVTTSEAGPVVSAMLHHPKARKLSFTGSTRVGKILLKEASDQVINCSMELGGNSPFIVMDCADVEEAVEGAMAAKMRNGGEACTAANRFFVQRGIYDRFVSRFAEEMAKVKTGRGSDVDVECGPLITKAAVAKVEALVSEAISDGARTMLGGEAMDQNGFFYPPTVLADVKSSSRILQEEIFGPVGVIVPVADEEEAIALANDTEYGLVAYVYCGDLKRALRISDRLECGMVGINKGVVSDVAAPFGGTKQSGLGREGSHHGIMEFLEPKYVAVNW